MSVRSASGASDALALHRRMLLIRRFEEACAELYAAERIRGFLHLYVGEEAVAVGALDVLGPRDSVVATYREHAHAIARGLEPGAIMAEMLGRAEGCSGGRGGSMHLFDRALGFFGGNAIVGAGLPNAVGIALAQSMREQQALTACFFGDGAVAEGAFHESLNLAALWSLPVLFVCENNGYAMGTAIDRALAQTDLAVLASRYGMPASTVDGMDVHAVRDASAAAADGIRAGGGPAFLECVTYRFRAHSMYDPERYRDRAEVERWRERDPILASERRLREEGLLDDPGAAALAAEAERAVAAAIAFADAGSLEPVEDLHRHLYGER